MALLIIGGLPPGTPYRKAPLVGNVGDIGEGAELRFLGYGATNFKMVTEGRTSRYVSCANWKLSRFVPSYKPADSELYSLGFEFGSYTDYMNGTNSGIRHNAPSICAGDSGGPIFVKHHGKFSLLGLNFSSLAVCNVQASAAGADLRKSSSLLLQTPVSDLRPKGARTPPAQGPSPSSSPSISPNPKGTEPVPTETPSTDQTNPLKQQVSRLQGKNVTVHLKDGRVLKGKVYDSSDFYLYLSTDSRDEDAEETMAIEEIDSIVPR